LHALRKENLANSIHVARYGEEALQFSSAMELMWPLVWSAAAADIAGPEAAQGGRHGSPQAAEGRCADENHSRGGPDSSKEERDLVSSYDLGANSYIQKPVDFDQFRETVKNVGLYWLLIKQPPVPDGAAHMAEPAAVTKWLWGLCIGGQQVQVLARWGLLQAQAFPQSYPSLRPRARNTKRIRSGHGKRPRFVRTTPRVK
jgi:two-component system response regulator